MTMVKAFPSCDTASGIPENSAIIKIYEDGFTHGYDILLVAGWNGTYTRIAASVLQKHDQLLSTVSEDAIKVTSDTSSGIESFSDQEFITTVPTTTTSTTTMKVTTSTTSTSTSTTTTTTVPNEEIISIPREFLMYSVIIIGVIIGLLLVFVVVTKNTSSNKNE
jgi:hypothetical protein